MGKHWVYLQSDRTPGNVEFRDLNPSDQTKFLESRRTEVQNLFDLGAYRLLSLEDSRRSRRDHPDNVLPSRFVERWKATDEGTT